MPHHKDAIKRLKQNEKRRARNRHFRSRMRNQIKKLRATISEGDVEQAQSELRTTMSTIHRVASKGVIHKNQAARKISRLNKAVKKLALGA
ncbi:MAG: 30S ribosomal protein S20 [Deltaproteobacteria bacterium]|nr:MAG: 30S ribosomal protein S20 [Deltaproteobacteria bacterium]